MPPRQVAQDHIAPRGRLLIEIMTNDKHMRLYRLTPLGRAAEEKVPPYATPTGRPLSSFEWFVFMLVPFPGGSPSNFRG